MKQALNEIEQVQANQNHQVRQALNQQWRDYVASVHDFYASLGFDVMSVSYWDVSNKLMNVERRVTVLAEKDGTIVETWSSFYANDRYQPNTVSYTSMRSRGNHPTFSTGLMWDDDREKYAKSLSSIGVNELVKNIYMSYYYKRGFEWYSGQGTVGNMAQQVHEIWCNRQRAAELVQREQQVLGKQAEMAAEAQ